MVSNHQSRCMLRTQQGAGHVDGHGRHKVFQRKIKERKNLGNACAINKDIATPIHSLDLREHSADRFGSADVQLNGLGARALTLKFGRQALGMGHVQISDPDFEPTRGNSSADFFADSLGATRDQSDP
jgi:hypothetical protein